MTLARLRRWFYLLIYGMWHGECACSVYNAKGELVALTTVTSEHRITMLWWERSRLELLESINAPNSGVHL